MTRPSKSCKITSKQFHRRAISKMENRSSYIARKKFYQTLPLPKIARTSRARHRTLRCGSLLRRKSLCLHLQQARAVPNSTRATLHRHLSSTKQLKCWGLTARFLLRVPACLTKSMTSILRLSPTTRMWPLCSSAPKLSRMSCARIVGGRGLLACPKSQAHYPRSKSNYR